MLDWLIGNWEIVCIAVLGLDKIVAATPCKWDDLVFTGLKAAFKAVSGGKLGAFLALALSVGLVSGCASVQDGSTFVWPEACYTTGDDGTQTLDSDALIPTVVSAPTVTSLSLQLANIGAIEAGLYTAEQALEVIDLVDGFAESAGSYSEMAAYVIEQVDRANSTAGVVVFTTLAKQFITYKTPITACDLAIIRAHLAKQRAVVESMTGGGE